MEPLHRASFEITEADVLAVRMHAVRTSPMIEDGYRRNRRNGIIAWLTVTGITAAVCYLTAGDPRRGLRMAGFSVLVWVVALPIYAARHLTRRAFERRVTEGVERMMRKGLVPVSLGPCEVLLYPDQLMVVERDEQLAKPWAAISGVEQEPDGVYIRFTDGGTMRVPRRAFSRDDDLARFVRTVEELVGGMN